MIDNIVEGFVSGFELIITVIVILVLVIVGLVATVLWLI